MADNFQFNFEMDWSNAERSTKRFFQQIRAELNKLTAEQNKLAPVDRITGERILPAEGTPAARRLAEIQAQRAIPDQVADRRERLIATKKLNELERANAQVAAEAAAAQKLRVTEERAITARLLATNTEYLKATEQLALNRRRLAAAEQLASQRQFIDPVARSPAAKVLNDEARVGVNKSILEAQAQIRRLARISDSREGFGGLSGYAKTIAQGTVARETETNAVKAAIAAEKAQNQQYLTSLTQATIARREEAAATKSAVNTALSARPDLLRAEAQNAVNSQRITAQRAVIESELLLADEQTLGLKARQIVAEREVTAALNRRAQTELTAAIQSGRIAAGTRFQQLQASIAGRVGGTPRLPSEFQTFGQFTQSKALTTAGFAVSGAAFFGIFEGVRRAVTEATELEKQFALIQTQLEQMDSAGDLPQLRAGILGAARDSGVAASQIAFLALQLRGAFSEDIARRGIGFLNQELESAGRLARVTGLPLEEVTDSLTGLAKTFGISFREIGGITLFLQQRFGVLAKETIEFAADIGPVAREAGLSFRELATIGASIQRVSGRSGTSIAEALGRILPAIQENGIEVLNIFDRIPALQGAADRIASNLAQGKTGPIFKEIIKNYNDLTKAQQNAITTALGGRREASTLNALFSDTRGVLRALKDIQDVNAGDVLDQQFERLQETIGQVFAQLEQAALQLGVGLLQSGVLDFIKDMASGLKLLLAAIQPILGAFKSLTDFLSGGAGGGNILSKIATAGVAIQAARFLRSPQQFQSGQARTRGGGFIGGFANAISFGLLGRPGGPVGGAPSLQQGQLFDETGLARAGTTQGNRLGARIKAGVQGFVSNLFLPLSAASREAEGRISRLAFRPGELRAAAFSGAGLLVGVTALLQVFETISEARTVIEDASDKFNNQIAPNLAKNPAKLRETALKMKQAGEGAFSPLESLISPEDSPVDQAIDQANNRIRELQLRQLKALRRGGVRRFNGVNVNDAIASLSDDSWDDLTREQATSITQLFGRNLQAAANSVPSIKKILEAATRRRNFDDFTKAAEEGKISEDVQTTEELFKSGQISFNQFLDQLLQTRQNLFRIVSESNGPADPTISKQLAETDAKIREATSAVVKKRLDTLLQIRRVRGEDVGAVDIGLLTSALNDPQFTDAGQRADVLGEVFSTLSTILRQRIDAAQTAAEKLRVGQAGIDVPEEAEVANARVQVESALASSSVSGQAIQRLTTLLGENDLNTLFDRIARVARTQNISIRDATVLILRQLLRESRASLARLRGLRRQGDLTKKQFRRQAEVLNKEITALNKLLKEVSKDESLDVGVEDVGTIRIGAQEAEDLRRQAAEEAKQKAEEARQNARELADARNDFFKALVENDPVRAAQAEINAADIAAFFATNEADRIRAAAQRIRAERQLQNAIQDIGDAMIELATAVADAGGDTVNVALLQLGAAQRRLAFAQQTGAGAAAITRAQADVVRAQAQLRDTQLQDQLETIQFNLEVQNISRAQAVAQLETILSQADVLRLTEKQRRDLILRIQQLRQEVSRDLQFNLPSELRLPTLYEVRRLNQTGGAYQDNRTIEITLNASGQFDGDAAVQNIISAIEQPPVFGTRPRIY